MIVVLLFPVVSYKLLIAVFDREFASTFYCLYSTLRFCIVWWKIRVRILHCCSVCNKQSSEYLVIGYSNILVLNFDSSVLCTSTGLNDSRWNVTANSSTTSLLSFVEEMEQQLVSRVVYSLACLSCFYQYYHCRCSMVLNYFRTVRLKLFCMYSSLLGKYNHTCSSVDCTGNLMMPKNNSWQWLIKVN